MTSSAPSTSPARLPEAYYTARRELDDIVRDHPDLRRHTVEIGQWWERLHAKDPTCEQLLAGVRAMREHLAPRPIVVSTIATSR